MKITCSFISFILSLALTTFPLASIAEDFCMASQPRALESVLWGIPIVSTYAMREAYFRDAKAQYGDVVYWSKPADWKFQIATPNASSYYVYMNFNTKGGPVVVEIPPALGAGMFGSFNNAWQVPLADLGTEGEDKGKGGKYLLLPPHYEQKIPPGYIPIHSETYNIYSLLRVIPASASEQDRVKAMEMVQKVHSYPLNKAANPATSKHIDMAGKLFDGIVKYDDTFFDGLAKMVNEEPIQTRDLVAIAQLRSVGIQKGKSFNPDPATRMVLKKIAEQTHTDLMNKAVTTNKPFWEGKDQWGIGVETGPKTDFTFITSDGFYDIDERAMFFYLGCAPPKTLGKATFYLSAFVDTNGMPFIGDKTYHLHIPANVPAKQYWSVTVYDFTTAAFLKTAPVLTIDSYHTQVNKNSDGSIDVYFGPQAPQGKEANWIYTTPGKSWFTFFRFYGPEKALFDKTWRLNDIEELQ